MKVIICSDIHGIYLDQKAVDAFIRVVKVGKFDEVVINGDTYDFPLLSRHSQRLIRSGMLKDYSESKEIELVKEKVLKPLREATKGKIILRLGNHDERAYYPYSISQSQLERLIGLWDQYGTRNFDEMIGTKEIGFSLAKKAAEKNILERMNSGSSGHTHRLNSTYINNAGHPHCWMESGHLRQGENVEYFPTAKTPDWQQGFVTVRFDMDKNTNVNDKAIFFARTHPIINGRAEYKDKII
jgi:Icc-related predicted phosphoesterase